VGTAVAAAGTGIGPGSRDDFLARLAEELKPIAKQSFAADRTQAPPMVPALVGYLTRLMSFDVLMGLEYDRLIEAVREHFVSGARAICMRCRARCCERRHGLTGPVLCTARL
jgi:hypothetical protein